jgi:hypothetical protein
MSQEIEIEMPPGGCSRLFFAQNAVSQQIAGLISLAFTADYTSLEQPRPPKDSGAQHDGLSLPLTPNREFPYTPGHLNRVLITITSPHPA